MSASLEGVLGVLVGISGTRLLAGKSRIDALGVLGLLGGVDGGVSSGVLEPENTFRNDLNSFPISSPSKPGPRSLLKVYYSS